MDLRLLTAAVIGWAVLLAVLRLPPAVGVSIAVAGAAMATGALVRAVHLHADDVLVRTSRQTVARRWHTAALTGLVVLLLAGGCVAQRAARTAGPIPGAAVKHRIVTVTGTVLSDPRPIAGAGGRQLLLVRVRAETVQLDGQQSDVSTPVLVFGSTAWSSVTWRDDVRFRLRLSPADSPAQDVVAVGSAIDAPQRLSSPGLLLGGLDALRSDLRDVTAHLPPDAAGLVPAMVIGDTSGVPEDLSADLRAAGLTHLTAVSGANVVFVMMAVGWLAAGLRVRRRWRLPVILAGLGVFVLLCRPEPSVLRAAVMGGVAVLGSTWAGRRAGHPALGAAIVVLLTWDPWLAVSYGFALSALATAGLLVFARPWGVTLARHLPERVRPLAHAAAIPIAAQAMCAPVIVLLQSSVSIVGLPANLLAAPLVAPATLGGVITVLVAPLGPTVAWLPSWVAGLPALGIAWIARTFARVPGGSMPWPAGIVGAVLLALLTLLALLCGPWLADQIRRRPVAPAMMAVLVLAVVLPVPGSNHVVAQWVYVACDVGQGDGGVIRLGDDRALVVDTGPDPDAMDACLQRLGVHTIDTVILTHFHADHVDGLSGVLRGRSVREILTTPVDSAGDATHEEEPSREPQVLKTAADAGVPVRRVHAGDTLSWSPQVSATVLWPARRIDAGSVQNNASVVLDLQAWGVRLLLTGDLEKEADAAVLSELIAAGGPRFDVLKVAHHGSKNQLPQLISEVHPTIAVISVGVDNDYGHPAPATLDLLRSAGAAVYRTDLNGDVAVSVDAGQVEVGTAH